MFWTLAFVSPILRAFTWIVYAIPFVAGWLIAERLGVGEHSKRKGVN